jgi:hypothetical protein
MSYMLVNVIPGFNQDKYDQVRAKMGLDKPDAMWPDGMIQHHAGALEDGGWCIVEEWRSHEDFQRFCDAQPKDPKMLEDMGDVKQQWFKVYHAHHADEESESEFQKAA